MANIVKEQASCEGVFHVLIRQDNTELIDAIRLGLASAQAPLLTAEQLLDLGSIWYIPARESNPKGKAIRLSNKGSSIVLVQKGDGLRIHTAPRRYRHVDRYDWNLATSPLVVGRGGDDNDDWCVVYKPAHIPVHALVDNARETLVGSLLQANTLQRVWVPQRLDIDTAGLLVVATSARFASYYAELLRSKTRNELASSPRETSACWGIRKGYRCLVQPQPQTASPVQLLLQANQVLCHYMEQTKGTPKRFVDVIPNDASDQKYLQCRLRIVAVQECPVALVVPPTETHHARSYLQVHVELLTGRTHQIRGQLAAVGYPIVGDPLYHPNNHNNSSSNSNDLQQKLALECHRLAFVDPDDSRAYRPSSPERWNHFDLSQLQPPWTGVVGELSPQR